MRSTEIIDIIDDPKRMLRSLEKFLARRAVHASSGPVASEDVAVYDAFAIGNRYGRFDEIIIRREIRQAGVPDWFDPRETPGQYGIVPKIGARCYLQVEVDDAKRDAPSTFDEEILSLVERNPEQVGLFG